MNIIEPSNLDIQEMAKSIQESFTIECVPCGHEDTVYCSSKQAAARNLLLGGWKVVENEAWCDECVESSEQTPKEQGQE